MKPFVLLFALVTFSCSEQALSPRIQTGIEGQTYEMGGPAPSLEPTPLRGIWTIQVSDSDKVLLQTVSTDSAGAFRICLQPGTYYLMVSDALWTQSQNGPFVVVPDQVTTVKVYHDNGMR
jgi:hypothetical protein